MLLQMKMTQVQISVKTVITAKYQTHPEMKNCSKLGNLEQNFFYSCECEYISIAIKLHF